MSEQEDRRDGDERPEDRDASSEVPATAADQGGDTAVPGADDAPETVVLNSDISSDASQDAESTDSTQQPSEPDGRDDDEGADEVSPPQPSSHIHDQDWHEEVETSYEQTATGHRLIRRVTRKRTTKRSTFSEETETQTEEDLSFAAPTPLDAPPMSYQAPGADAHPAPVG